MVHDAVDDTIAYRAELPVRVDDPVLSDDPVLWHGLVLPDSWWSDLAGTLEKVSAARHRPRRRTAALLAAPPGHRGPRPRRLPRPGQPCRPRRRRDRVRAAAPDRQPRGQPRPQGPAPRLVRGPSPPTALSPLGRKVTEAIGTSARSFRTGCEFPNHPALWITKRGGRLRPGSINDRFEAYRDALGLPKGLVPHSLRHSYVTHLTEDGVDRRFIQQQVGHESDSSLAIYTHVSDDFMNTSLHKALAPAFAGA
ncbi:tyrosine-type recombinase/integrase [Streptomyces griseoaurantiacus]|uniref:tyrosine-type recombinase/integrase n=1 Tax=Streptomyces griseoaurantiacus TaxID=68213 RepID=UPI0036822626